MKKKIGIITYSRTQNYGAILQCYALQEVLKAMDYDVQVINYKQPFESKSSSVISWNYFWRNRFHPGNILRYIMAMPQRWRVYKSFNDFKKRFISCTKQCTQDNIPQDFDIYLLGSDQLWTLSYSGGIDKVFWGQFEHPNKSLICGYAISSNKESIDSINANELKKLLSHFDVISLRELTIKRLLQEKCNDIDFRVDVDPTILADEHIWYKIIDEKWAIRDFVVTYQVARSQNDILYKKALDLANQLGCEVIDLSTYEYSPQEFVSVIKYSKCVLTTSFHGVAFGIIFHRPLWVGLLNDGHDGRYVDLLTDLEATGFLHPIDAPPRIIDLNYQAIAKVLNVKRGSSFEYLKSLNEL